MSARSGTGGIEIRGENAKISRTLDEERTASVEGWRYETLVFPTMRFSGNWTEVAGVRIGKGAIVWWAAGLASLGGTTDRLGAQDVPAGGRTERANGSSESAEVGGHARAESALSGLGPVRYAAFDVEFQPVVEGVLLKSGGAYPDPVDLRLTAPEGLERLPDGLVNPKFGLKTFGGGGRPVGYLFVYDEAPGKPPRLWIDRNADRDLSNDGEVPLRAIKYKSRRSQGDLALVDWDGWEGETTITLQYPRESLGEEAWDALDEDPSLRREARIIVRRFNPEDPLRKNNPDGLSMYADFGVEGTITLGRRRYRACLFDEMGTGDFRGIKGAKHSGVRLLVDVDGDGKIAKRGEQFDVSRPFNLGGVTFEIEAVTPSGRRARFALAEEWVPEIPLPPKVELGDMAPAFSGESITDGTSVRFPEGYIGKLVLVQFVFTQWPRSLEDMKTIRQALDAYAGRGLACVSVVIDSTSEQEDLATLRSRVLKAANSAGLGWPMLCDGMGGEAGIAGLYSPGINPTVYLVDTRTGKIVARARELTGEHLLATLERIVPEWEARGHADGRPEGGAPAGETKDK